MSKVEQIFKCNNILGEGITYSNLDENLFWLDISNKSKLYKTTELITKLFGDKPILLELDNKIDFEKIKY